MDTIWKTEMSINCPINWEENSVYNWKTNATNIEAFSKIYARCESALKCYCESLSEFFIKNITEIVEIMKNVSRSNGCTEANSVYFDFYRFKIHNRNVSVELSVQMGEAESDHLGKVDSNCFYKFKPFAEVGGQIDDTGKVVKYSSMGIFEIDRLCNDIEAALSNEYDGFNAREFKKFIINFQNENYAECNKYNLKLTRKKEQ